MSKILRLHATGSSTHEGWGPTGPLGPAEIEQIRDPDGGKAAQVAVAIPSPFARLHLVETALRFVRQGGSGGGTQSVYHRLVSHFWDVWELVFNQLQGQKAGHGLRVRPWNRATQLAALQQRPETRPLADVLGLFAQDGRFRDFTDLYLLYFVGAGGQETLVGGTSPLSVLFPAPNLAPLPVQRLQGGGQYFDHQYVPLEARETAFQDYVYALFVAEPALAALAPEVYAALDNGRLQQLKFGAQASAAAYPPLADAAGNPVYVAGVALRTRPDESVIQASDFFVQPTRPEALAAAPARRPLALRPGLKAPGRRYFNSTVWDEATPVPAHDPAPLHERRLPGKGLQHPYLTLDDLLETTLLAVPYEVNDAQFYGGTLRVAAGHRPTAWPLLPLRPLWFEYFTPHDLAEQLSLELDPMGVRVRLRIPVQGGHTVDYERNYYLNPQAEGAGRLLITNVGLSVFPFVKIVDAPQYNDFFKVMLVDANNRDPRLVSRPIALRFGVDGRELTPQGSTQAATAYVRTPKTGTDEGSTYYEVRGTHFDYMEVLSPAPAEGRALVVPRWREVRQGPKEFRFAIDFGTTNTYVAWHDAPNQPPQPFAFGPDDSPVALLKKPADAPSLGRYDGLFFGIDEDPARYVGIKRWRLYQQREFIPPLLGAADSPYVFPIRTATSEAPGFAMEAARVLDNVNVGFGINTEEQTGESYHTNLKWGGQDEASRKRVTAFFRQMLLLFKYKAVLNGGRLDATQLVWFAPLSFSGYARNLYQAEWDRLFQEIFRTTRSTSYLPESSAPYFYLTRRGLVTPGPGENAAFVDIGGGTTDVLLYADRRPVLSTSFRFAGNDLWGDGSANVRGSKDNGLVRFGLASVAASPPPATEAARAVRRCLDVVVKNHSFGSEEVASLLFNYESEFQFSDRLLRAEPLRVLFYLHFGALVYHVGQVAALAGLAPPRYLCFTGRGSLYVRLLSAGPNLRAVEQLAQTILGKVSTQPVPANFKIFLADDPKQTTANGGVLATGQDANSTLEDPPIVRPVGTGALDEAERRGLEPAQISEEVKAAVLANVRRCLHLLLEDPDLVRQQANLGVKNAPGQVLRILDAHLADSFNLGRQLYADTLQPGEAVPETLFFLPLKQALYALSQELYQQP